MSKYINCESEIKPQEKGFYGVYIQNIRPAVQQYLEFNGKEWVNLESVKLENESNGIYWSEGEKPLKELPVFNI